MQADPNVIDFIKKQAAKFPGITEIKLFGSRARGDARERSDYDFAIFEKEGSDNLRFFLDVEEQLPTLCGVNLIKVTDNLKPELLKRIQQEGISIFTQTDKV